MIDDHDRCEMVNVSSGTVSERHKTVFVSVGVCVWADRAR